MPEFSSSEDWRNGGFGLYIHWPFCESKCPYCDFNSHVARAIDFDAWQAAYLSEIARVGTLTPGRVLNSVFFGGGTPSLMEPRIVDAVLSRVRETWPNANDIEITLEANPGSVEAGRFGDYAAAGVNRISMGIQALNDIDLKRLGRLHSTRDALQAFDIARARFDRVSFDLIYARQDQEVESWRAELTKALSLGLDHLSLYQLTIEPGTAFGSRYRAGKLAGLPDEDRAVALYEVTQDLCGQAGLPGYEVSNHARSGAESRHNLIYWRYGDYAGIGPGAHGRLTLANGKTATEAWSAPDRWLNAVKAGNGDKSSETLSPPDQADEYMIMCMRLLEGMDIARYKRLGGAFNDDKLDEFLGDGLLRQVGSQLIATSRGRLLLNAVIAALSPATVS